MICFKCGHSNGYGSNYCSRCNAVLPKMDHVPQVEAEAPVVNDRYLLIQEACDRVLSGASNLDEFAAFVEGVTSALTRKDEEMRQIEIPPETYEEFREELEVGFAGVELFFEGLRMLRLFVEQPEPSHIESGLELIREGNTLINDAMRINRANRRRIEEIYVDSSTML